MSEEAPASTRKYAVAVYGDLMIDRTTVVEPVRLSPEDPTCLVVEAVSTEDTPGGSGNVARGVSALLGSGQVCLYTAWTHKQMGGMSFNSCMFQPAIDIYYSPGEGAYPVKHRFVSTNGRQLLRVDERPDRLVCTDPPKFGERRTVTVLCDYDKGYFPATEEEPLDLAAYAPGDGPVLVDPGRHGYWRRFDHRRTVFKANVLQCLRFLEQEGRSLPFPYRVTAPTPAEADKLADAVRGVMSSEVYKSDYAVITLGAGGVIVVSPLQDPGKHQVVRQGPLPGSIDPCGAGDTVLAALAAFLSKRPAGVDAKVLIGAAVYADRAARIAVSRPGVYAVTAKDMGE